MELKLFFAVIMLLWLTVYGLKKAKTEAEAEAEILLTKLGPKSDQKFHDDVIAQWNYDANLTDYNKEKMIKAGQNFANFTLWRQDQIVQFDWSNFTNKLLKRKFKMQSLKGKAALPPSKFQQLQNVSAYMQGKYGKGTIPQQNNKSAIWTLDPDLTKIMGESRDYKELEYVWKEWRNAVGKPIKAEYEKYVELSNQESKLNGFDDYSQYVIKDYESKTFVDDIESLWLQIKPLYQELHYYVKGKLIEEYGNDKIKADGTIPAHLLGNMWAQTWSNIFNIATPYKNKTMIDVTKALKSQNYTPKAMFKTSEKFFVSLGLKNMTKEFWENSIITKPKDIDIVCHGSAWDFGNKKDFRIKMCTVVTMEDFITIHHEMGHIQYFMQYEDQPLVFREAANPGFHEAIGDTLALSVLTPEHLKKVKLLDKIPAGNETDLNFLMSMALEKISFLPFSYILDKWRWEVFSGKTPVSSMNSRWWQLREEYQGISPPIERNEDDFDPGCKYHVPAGVPYVRYFVSFVIQFQFHEALCKIGGYTGPLHHCDISSTPNAKGAGDKLAQMLKLGSSKPWPEALQMLTGTKKMNASSLLRYFQPLQNWLEKQNKNKNVQWKIPNIKDAMKPDKPKPVAPKPTPGSSVTFTANLILVAIAALFVHQI